MIKFLIILFVVLVPVYLTVSAVHPELAWFFGIAIFSIFACYLVYRIILETVLYKKQEDEEEENENTFGLNKTKTFYDIYDFRKALKNRYKNK